MDARELYEAWCDTAGSECEYCPWPFLSTNSRAKWKQFADAIKGPNATKRVYNEGFSDGLSQVEDDDD